MREWYAMARVMACGGHQRCSAPRGPYAHARVPEPTRMPISRPCPHAHRHGPCAHTRMSTRSSSHVPGAHLPDPPSGVRREPKAAAGVKPLGGPDEAEGALLDQIRQRQAAASIPVARTTTMRALYWQRACMQLWGELVDEICWRRATADILPAGDQDHQANQSTNQPINQTSRPTYFLAIETTKRRLADISLRKSATSNPTVGSSSATSASGESGGGGSARPSQIKPGQNGPTQRGVTPALAKATRNPHP